LVRERDLIAASLYPSPSDRFYRNCEGSQCPKQGHRNYCRGRIISHMPFWRSIESVRLSGRFVSHPRGAAPLQRQVPLPARYAWSRASAPQIAVYSMRIPIHTLVAVTLAMATPHSARTQASRPILAVFAHPDDERVIGPLLSKLAREGRETHLVIATDGSQGVRDFAHIAAGAELAAARTKEAQCAANRLGVRQLHLLGLPDGGLASFEVLGKLRSGLAAIIDSLKPVAIITFGPEGGTGHPDHRLVGDVVTQIIQGDTRYANVDVLYASLPTERLRTAPPAEPTVNGMAESLLTVRVPFEERDLAAGREEFACHRTQYAPAEMDAVNKYLAHAWNGMVWMRPWNGTLHDPGMFRP
jgi:LmbE family N-acetylglucosaminyl deacetylase